MYNEEENIEPVVRNTTAELDRHFPGDYELVIVDDGSSDNSYAASVDCAGKYPGVKICRHKENAGFGAALRTGYLASRGQYVSLIPADGEVEVDQVVKLYYEMESADLIISQRNRSVPFHREILTAGWWFCMKLFLGFDVRIEGIMVMRRSLLDQIGLERVTANTGLVNIEIPMRAIKLGCDWKQSVIDTKPRLSGESKVVNLRTTLLTLWETFKLRFTISADTRSETPGTVVQFAEHR
jgi:glycosyltransferase involved in cell wall biosynthesis